MRFPGFLRLLKRVTEENVCDIQRHSTRIIAQESEEEREREREREREHSLVDDKQSTRVVVR